VAEVNMHMIFTGNPGTGKTTIARILAKYLKAIGALRGGQLVEVTRADLVGRYVGHTAPLTNQVIQSALGGVLFIDEAYSLVDDRNGSFGDEAISTIVQEMENLV
jgi:SpoVK/Ycf46/Vps4 family AAA+-type ATPase